MAVRRIRRTTIAGVALLALIAAVVSFRHMHELCLRYGEDHLAAVLIPLAADGLRLRSYFRTSCQAEVVTWSTVLLL
ncbi:DUF2637 domain-containing protein [Microbispora hainanensis]|uniref:DUF2637 domain-containing protein n=1 Tax=Microbispora hainanensis TaxID=568844 RepID=A0A544XYE7_9ACTN|nr:DUF2637 domain-containing protein [Microbispora hainanensis]